VTTKADFYDGRGPSAVWLGSLQGDADPETVRTVACGRLVLDATDPFTYADAVTDLLDVWGDDNLGHGHHPHDGWPWLWPDSQRHRLGVHLRPRTGMGHHWQRVAARPATGPELQRQRNT
jgi:hypothetical protein